jgi:hypothetical protein
MPSEEALDAVLVPRPQQVVDGRVHAAEAAIIIQQTLDGRYDYIYIGTEYSEYPHARVLEYVPGKYL